MNLLADFTIVTGIVTTLVILILLFHSPRKGLPNQVLKIIFITLFFVALTFYGLLHELKIVTLIGFLFYESVGYLLGPLLLIYIQSLYRKDNHFLKKYKKHFIPLAIFLVVIAIPLWLSIATGDFIFAYLEKFSELQILEYEVLFQALYLMGYCGVALIFLQRRQNVLKLNYSNLKQKDLNWVRNLVIGILIIISIDFAISIYEMVAEKSDSELRSFTIFPLVIMMVYLGYYGLLQARILIPEFLLQETVGTNKKAENGKAHHHLTNASEEEKEKLKNRLLEILATEKPFLDENLTLGSLAEFLPTTDKKLSALLNHHLQITFYDLVNKYRVEEVKSKMGNAKFSHYTLLAIALDCGFKSKSSFNRIFKKETGLSPTQYKVQAENI